MKLFGFNIFGGTTAKITEPKSFLEGNQEVITGTTTVRSYSFNGEKTPGELGPPINVLPDYRGFRLRAYEADLKEDIVKIITGKFFKWVVGTGLKISVDPNMDVLNAEGVTINQTEFSNNLESYFTLYANSQRSDFSGMESLHEQAQNAFRTSFLGGDCLIVCRLDETQTITVQVIDGQHVVTPFLDSKYIDEANGRGNIIKHGIELNKRKQHIAYYVVTQDGLGLPTFERIAAKTSSGITMAWMLYGDKHRIDHIRGISSLSAILEKIKKLDRYTEASVGSAEERAKIVYSIEHSRFSDGENPFAAMVKKNTGTSSLESSYEIGKTLETKIQATTGKTTVNMPVDSKLKSLDSQSEINFEPFWKAIFVQLSASLDVPPEVALQQYNSNYSASRAAINGWEYIVYTYRHKVQEHFYKPIYRLFLYVHALKGKVQVDGYLKAIDNGNFYITEGLANARFIGRKLPHIDPLKEAKAIRTALGDRTKNELPLINHEQATEELGFGNYWDNINKYKQEVKELPKDDATDSETKK